MIGQQRPTVRVPEITNPSNAPEKGLEARKRISMSLPAQRLAVPDIPGFHLHWMRGDKGRLDQALKAGYEFVDADEVELNRTGLGNSGLDAGNEDMGSQVSLLADMDGSRLYLMKLPQAFWNSDTEALAERQENIAGQLRGDKGYDAPGGDNSHRYSKQEQTNFLQPKGRKA